MTEIRDRLVICTPSSTPRNAWSECFLSELRDTTGCHVRINGASNVAMARNEVSALAYNRHPERDLWLWIDDDEYSSIRDAFEFVERALDSFGPTLTGVLVSGTYARRDGSHTVAAGVDLRGSKRGYHKADWLPGGSLLHSVETFERMAAACPRSRYGETDGWMVYGNCLEIDGQGVAREAGEDVGFCRVAQRVGVECWLDTRWVLGHVDEIGIAHFPDWSSEQPKSSGSAGIRSRFS